MALSIRHSPYTIPSPRFNSMTTYNPPFNSAAASIHGPSTYNMPPSSMFGLQSASMFNSMSPLATSGTSLHGGGASSMSLLPGCMGSSPTSGHAAVDNTSGMSSLSLTDMSAPAVHSPGSCCSESPTSPPDLSRGDSPGSTTNPYSSCNMIYSTYSSPISPPASPLTNSILNDTHSPPPLHLPGTTLPYPAAPATMLPAPMYSSQNYSSSSLSNTMPMPMWSPYPSLPTVGPLPTTSLPKLSYDSPRYKLTPERAIPLIKWFEEHKEHPYPTRHEKIVLCQSTQLTFTQVSTWFANARRRMKKANSEEDDSSSTASSSSGSDCERSPAPSNSTVR